MGNQLKARIRNFQAIADVRFVAEGFTVITGKSNLGKTSLIRALSAILFGRPGDSYVRRGEDYAGGAISLTDSQGPLKIVWRKVPSNKRKPNLQPIVEVNGLAHTKVGRDHKTLTEPFGISEIETTATRLRPQVAMQHDPMFLIGESETTVAELFKLLGRVDIITDAQKLAKKDLTSTENSRKIRAKDLGDAEERKLALDHVPTLREKLDTLKEVGQEYKQGIKDRKAIEGNLTLLASLIPCSLPRVPAVVASPPIAHPVSLLRELTDLTPVSLPKPSSFTLQYPDKTAVHLLDELSLLVKELDNFEEALADNLNLTDALEVERQTLEAELGICPTCRRDFNEHS